MSIVCFQSPVYVDYQPYNSTLVNLTAFELRAFDGKQSPRRYDALQYVTAYDAYHVIHTAARNHTRAHECYLGAYCTLTAQEIGSQLQRILVRG